MTRRKFLPLLAAALLVLFGPGRNRGVTAQSRADEEESLKSQAAKHGHYHLYMSGIT